VNAEELRHQRLALVADGDVGGRGFGRAIAGLVDAALTTILAEAVATTGTRARVAVLALGSYARAELCPASDLDVLLLHDGGRGVAKLADSLWYPLWDAGFVTGHATRSIKEALTVADDDLKALTSMLGVRVVAGDGELAAELDQKIRGLAARRRARFIEALADAHEARQHTPGPIAEILEPNLKDGAGGLRDMQALGWAGFTLDGPEAGAAALVRDGYLDPLDPSRLERATELMLQVRVAHHRVTGRKGDEILLQDQEAVATAVGAPDADVLLRDLATAARGVAWIASDAWDRLRSAVRGPGSSTATGERRLADGIVLRDGRAALVGSGPPGAPDAHAPPSSRDTPDTPDTGGVIGGLAALRLAAEAAEHGVLLERGSVLRLAGLRFGPADWNDEARSALVRLLLAGERAVPVIEALDRVGAFAALVPGWGRVRSLPQRNAYHRYTVDRHLLEAVARCAALMHEEGFDGRIGRELPRPHLLALAALFHDIGKGLPGDHSHVGADIASEAMASLGFPPDEAALVELLVEHHLLMPDTATRRDLSEEATVVRVARIAGDVETLSLLYLLTVGDSIATGSSAWSSTKAALVRELYVKARHLLEQGEVVDRLAVERRVQLRSLLGAEEADRYLDALPASYPLAFDAEAMARHRRLLDASVVGVDWGSAPSAGSSGGSPEGMIDLTVVAPDRPGILATVTGVLAMHGLDVHDAQAYTRVDGMALEAYRIADPFGRVGDPAGRSAVERDLEAGLSGRLDIDERVNRRAARYSAVRRRGSTPQPAEVVFDPGASDFATVVEVHADDEIGLLYRICRTLFGLGLDVRLAKVATIGERVVDTFYLLTHLGEPLDDTACAALEAALLAEVG
jgi:[protein-PII] uridylyltransferase